MKTLKLLVLFTLFCLTGCDDGYMASYQSEVVVEGWIENEGFPVVMLTRSLPVMEDKVEVGNLYDYILRWAVVRVSCEDRSVVLTGKYDERYFPPYIYTTSHMKGEVGKTYTLTVDDRDIHAEATTSILPPPSFDSIRIDKVSESDTLCALMACFADPKDEQNYYQLWVKTGGDSRQFLAAYLGSISDHSLNGYAETPVNQGHRFRYKHYTPYFTVGDTVAVKLAQVDSLSHQYWSEYDKSITLSNNMMFPKSTNLPTNIRGGIGYWCGMGSTVKQVVIPCE